MAMLGPADREEDRAAGRRALYLMLGLGALLAVFFVAVVVYYNSYGY